MLTVALSLTAAVSWGFHDFLVQPVTRRASAFTAMFWVLAASTVILTCFSLTTDGLPSQAEEWRGVAIAAFGGILYTVGMAVLLHGLAVGNLSIVTPLCSLMGGMAALAAILLGERVGTLSGVALPLAVAGALLTSLVKVDGASGEAPSRSPRRLRPTAGAGWGLAAALLFGATFLVYGYADGISAVSAAAWGRLTGMALFLPFALAKVPLVMEGKLYVRTTAAAFLDSGGYVAVAAALVLGPVSVASALSAQFATFAIFLGIVVLHERVAIHQRVGLMCTIIAVVLFALGA